MTLKEAVAKVEREIGEKVIGVADYKDRWIFALNLQQNTLSSVFWCCYKDTGEVGCFFPPDEPDVLKSAKEVLLSNE